jgi:hypothetical protein
MDICRIVERNGREAAPDHHPRTVKESPMSRRIIGLIALLSFCLVPSAFAQQPPGAVAGKKDHATAVKESLQTSMAALRQYEWIETTVVSMKGEEKSRTQNNCYYGADGKLQKVPVAAPAQDEEKKKRGVRGKIVENKKEEISGAAKEAVGLVKQYVPPDPAKIEAAKAAGKLSVIPPDAQGNVQIVIKDYLKPGDSLTLAANAATDRIGGVTVATFTDKEKDAVGLKVAFGAFADGTVYPAKIQLDVASQNLGVVIENSGYKKAGS